MENSQSTEVAAPLFDVREVCRRIIDVGDFNPLDLTPDQRMMCVQYLRYTQLASIAAIARAMKVTRNIVQGDLRVLHQMSGKGFEVQSDLRDELVGEIHEKLQSMYDLAVANKDPGVALKAIDMLTKFFRELGLMGDIKSGGDSFFDLLQLASEAKSANQKRGGDTAHDLGSIADHDKGQ